MQIEELIQPLKDMSKPYVRLYTALLDMRCSLDPNTRRLWSFVKEISEYDPISDYGHFYEKMREVKDRPEITISYYDNRQFYGYYEAIMKYASVDEKRYPYMMLDHGVRFGNDHWGKIWIKCAISYACQGPGRHSEVYEYDPWKPIFVMGPYIHYATDYYSADQIKQMKEKLGRVLLVFPSHTWERINKKTDQRNTNNLFDTVYEKYAGDYDTIMVCAYWHDIEDPVFSAFEKNGAMLVSAGFRNDPNFVRRLKTIITLADAAVTDDLGTNMGFCQYLGKPVYLESERPRVTGNSYFTQNFERFHEAFYSPNKEFTPRQRQQQEELYEFFWGGEKYLKTPEEIRAIVTVLQEMCDATHYNIKKMPEFIRSNCPRHASELGYKLLAEAVDENVWK